MLAFLALSGGRVEVRARAKVNLGLEVLGRRVDGYHELRSVMWAIELADRVTLEASGSSLCSDPDPVLDAVLGPGEMRARCVLDGDPARIGWGRHVADEEPDQGGRRQRNAEPVFDGGGRGAGGLGSPLEHSEDRDVIGPRCRHESG